MSDLLSIGSSGVTAYQRALATVSNNIANVNTDGYTRQDVSLTANQPRQMGGGYLGTGARFDAVQRQYDAFVESNLRNSNSDLQSQKPLLSYVNRLIDVMGDESIGLTTAMNRFFESSRDLASDPASVVSRSIFVRDADGLAARFRQLAGQFELLGNETRQAIETDVGQINALSGQLALMNKQLTKHSTTASQPSELLDQRDLLLRELSSLVAVKTKFEVNGAVTVSVGDTLDQGILVKSNVSRAITVNNSQINPGTLEFVLDAYGSPEPMPGFSSGKIGGVISFRDQVLSPAADALDTLSIALVKEVNLVHRDGVDAEGLLGGDLFGFTAEKTGQAAGMQLLIQDANRVAAAGQFRVIDNPLNSGTAQARIQYITPEFKGPTQLRGDLALAQVPQIITSAISIDANQGFANLGLVPIGTQDLSLGLLSPKTGQTLQVLTRDGRHLLGSSLTENQQALLVNAGNGMEAGATYSAQALNKTPPATYLGMDIFLGAQAAVSQVQQFNSTTGEAQAPLAVAAQLVGNTFAGSSGAIAANTYQLNGQNLPALSGPLTLGSVVNWINTATASQAASARITASDVDGKLVLSRPSSNTTDDIRLGMGSAGTPADLQRLGFDTTLHIKGSASDDLLVFVTDTAIPANAASSTVDVRAQFAHIDGDMKQSLRTSTLQVSFTSDTEYTIVDSRTTPGTVLAERSLIPDPLSATPSLTYRGLKLEFSTSPKAGDEFTIDGNRDGIGNNETMLRLVALEEQRIMPGGLTVTEAYIERVNQVGNVARQAAISEQALEVVYKQAQEARDTISGVSLDEEASALVRFQQAYQANAKVMQTAMALFDAILQVR
jgi:flagellar hook-associated protein 1 FlgK